jgi:hypothetical protein
MLKKLAFLSLAIIALMVTFSFSAVSSTDQSITCIPAPEGIVDKAPSQMFTVQITFKNTGKTEGTWSINISFEGEKWTWTGTAQTITLEPDGKKTLTWNGTVPADAPIDTVARLIVYYGDTFKALDWWIHVVPSAQLTITYSNVK